MGVRDSDTPQMHPSQNFPPLELPSTSFSIDTVCASCCYGHCAVDIANISIHSIANSHLLLKLDNKDIHLPFVCQRHSFLSIGDFNPSQSIPTRLPDTDHLTKRSSLLEGVLEKAMVPPIIDRHENHPDNNCSRLPMTTDDRQETKS